MQNTYGIKLVITKVFITVIIIICGMIYISASLQDIKVTVNFETRHQHFVRNGFSMKNRTRGKKVIDFFHPQGFTKKKGKHKKLKKLIIRAFSDVALMFQGPEPCPPNKLTNWIICAFFRAPQRVLVNLGHGIMPPPPPLPPTPSTPPQKNQDLLKLQEKVRHQIIHPFFGVPLKFWVDLVWMAARIITATQKFTFSGIQ